MQRKVVFDMDDTLWDLNERACRMAGIDFSKLQTFSLTDNPLLTASEKTRLSKVYNSIELWRDIIWDPYAADIITLEKLGAKVFINSNCMNQAVADFKRQFVPTDLKLPDSQVILNVVTDGKRKELDDDMFIFVDDSPFNIGKSTAKYNIIPNRPWNQDAVGYRRNSLKDIIELCKVLLRRDEDEQRLNA